MGGCVRDQMTALIKSLKIALKEIEIGTAMTEALIRDHDFEKLSFLVLAGKL